MKTGTTTCKVYLRSSPRNIFCYPVEQIPINSKVQILESEGGWLKVRSHDKVGYLRKDLVRLETGEDEKYWELPEVLLKELRLIQAARGEKQEEDLPFDDDKESRLLNLLPRLHKARLVALCLSGGGIRSATFNLGVLQGLAKSGVLREMDYLSTVSGGGYIGSWLSSWISRETGSAAARFDQVIKTLAQESPGHRGKEPYQVKFLRDYSNYLTPRVGIFSIDTWAILGTYLRNLLLNWLVLLPLLFAVLLLPRVLVDLVSGAVIDALPMVDKGLLAHVCAAFGAAFGMFPIAYTVTDLPGIGNMRRSKSDFVMYFLVPLLLMACFLSSYWGYTYRPGCNDFPGLASFILFGAGVHLAGWVVGLLCLREKLTKVLTSGLRCAASTGVLAGLLGWVAATRLMPALLEPVIYPKLLYATLSVPVILAVYLLAMSLVVAFLSRDTEEQDREWWGRAAGVVILAGLVWSAGMSVVIYGPWLLLPDASNFWKETYTAVGAGSGIAAAIFGKDPSTPALRPGVSLSKVRTTLLAVAAGVFLLFLAQSLALLATVVIRAASYASTVAQACLPGNPLSGVSFPELGSAGIPLNFHTHLYMLSSAPLVVVLVILVLSAMGCLVMAMRVDVNKFSMHAMYRNRLVNCYLGASQEKAKRRRHPFTGFDPQDDSLLSELRQRPFHVVNMAWNLVKGKRLAWQQRKAASFIMSPLFAGSDIDPDPSWEELLRCEACPPGPACGDIHPDPKKVPQFGGYRPIEEYGAGEMPREKRLWTLVAGMGKELKPMTLGTAMAISGAAASPNMGYHSSPLVTFVMAFFNVRLGWWLGNPGTRMGSAWRVASPGWAVLPLLRETFGFTREESKDIYLSDGGHFENLGLYEMVRRRCRYIIVSDAGCDCENVFQDLGNAVRKVRADLGIEIEIDTAAIREKKTHFAVGTVKYALCDDNGAENGILLYIKPTLTGEESVDQFNYAKMHHEFPHEPTSDQWFDEAQFESYRRLGLHSIEQLVKEQNLTVEELCAQASRSHKCAVRKIKGAKAAGLGAEKAM